MAKNFWLIVERGSYVATLFVGLVEVLKVCSSASLLRAIYVALLVMLQHCW